MKKFLVAAAALILASCAAKSVENASLENTTWKLTEMNGETDPAFEAGDAFTFTLNGESVNGKGSVNRFFGSYELTDGDGLVFGDNMGMTRMMGENIELEDAYMRMFAAVDGYSVEGDVLTLTSNGEKVAEFVLFNPETALEETAAPVGVPVISIEEVEVMQKAE